MLSQNIKIVFYTFSILLLAAQSLAAPIEIQASYSKQHSPPLVIRDQNYQAYGGILIDIYKAIDKHAIFRLTLLEQPRNQISKKMSLGTIELNCAANPAWYSDKSLRWSVDIYNNPDLIFTRLPVNSVSELNSYKNIKIGVLAGYVYPELNHLFENTRTQRIDHHSVKANVHRYRSGEIDAMVISKSNANYLFNNNNLHHFAINNKKIYCAMSPQLYETTIEQLKTAIETLKESGEIDKILAKYLKG